MSQPMGDDCCAEPAEAAVPARRDWNMARTFPPLPVAEEAAEPIGAVLPPAETVAAELPLVTRPRAAAGWRAGGAAAREVDSTAVLSVTGAWRAASGGAARTGASSASRCWRSAAERCWN